jgi:DNA-binding MarR family transcriptional regulator
MTNARLDHCLTYRLHRVARLADRDAAADYLAACGLGLSEGRCLAAIGSFAPLSLNDLARAANQDKGHVSRSATALVDKGLVAKEASPDDARGVVLSLTRAGQRTFARAMQLIERRNAAAFAALSPTEKKQLGALLDKVTAALDAGGEER